VHQLAHRFFHRLCHIGTASVPPEPCLAPSERCEGVSSSELFPSPNERFGFGVTTDIKDYDVGLLHAILFNEELGFGYSRVHEFMLATLEPLTYPGYRLIIFRIHSSDVDPTGEIGLFTSELYREDQWVLEQVRGRLAYGHTIPDAQGPDYFAIVPAFISEEMRGRFNDTLLIIGGCKTLASPELAEAFLDRGASAVVGWDDVVDLAHNDRAILRLLMAIVGEKMSVEEAVRRTMIDIGPDPVYHSWPAAYINQGQ